MDALTALTLAAALTLPPEPPPLWELDRFPTAEQCAVALAMNAAFAERCGAMAAISSPPVARQWQEAAEENEAQGQPWAALAQARKDFWDVPYGCGQPGMVRVPVDDDDKLAALEWLKELLGPEAYYAGRLPPSVPVWRFQEIER